MNFSKQLAAVGLGAFIALVCNGLCHASYLEQDGAIWTDEHPVHRPPRILPPPTPPPPPAYDSTLPPAVERIIRNIHVGDPRHDRGLSVFPLEYSGRLPDQDIRTFDEAARHGWLEIEERDNPEVSVVMIRNTSRRPVFLMNGELISGGRQNRIIRDDILLEPRSWPTPVPVYCVEQERWEGPHGKFTSAKSAASPALRGKAMAGESQNAIWSEVDDQHRAAKIASRTRDYQRLYEDREVAKEIGDFTSRLMTFLPRNIVGLAVARGGRIIGIDIFGSADICSALREKILRSYAVENLKYTPYGKGATDRNAIQRVLQQVLRADFTARNTPGAGEFLSIRGGVRGSALLWNTELVHLAIFE